jgi:type I restriction enzyme, S subunit
MVSDEARKAEASAGQVLPEGWDVVQFDDAIARDKFHVGKVNRSDYQPAGRFPIIDQGQSQIAGYWDNEQDVYRGPLPVIIFGDHTRMFKFIDFPFVCGADGAKVLLPNTGRFDPPFLFYALLRLDLPSRGYNRHFKLLREQRILRPPLEEQQPIAEILHAVQLAKEATDKTITATRQLKRSLRRHLFMYGPVPIGKSENVSQKETEFGLVPQHWPLVNLGEVFKLSSGSSRPEAVRPRADSEYRYPVYGGNGVLGFAREYSVNRGCRGGR